MLSARDEEACCERGRSKGGEESSRRRHGGFQSGWDVSTLARPPHPRQPFARIVEIPRTASRRPRQSPERARLRLWPGSNPRRSTEHASPLVESIPSDRTDPAVRVLGFTAPDISGRTGTPSHAPPAFRASLVDSAPTAADTELSIMIGFDRGVPGTSAAVIGGVVITHLGLIRHDPIRSTSACEPRPARRRTTMQGDPTWKTSACSRRAPSWRR